ncbi:hypothetical protein EUTSA_v10027249mg [Eutrema salsugineum]|uniref:Bifunctional inhibitor/plant lipid transfer protein/seed storage helical domain-containing protein n=1 Tax=Eutrema salsugineum TaxID=72664 RepID=V4MHY4_EUTSA|nr:hypothetical protein EUTSA_v10027249mg [Eutrema salsugineum]
MAAQVSKKFCSVFMIIIILFTIMFSVQASHSNKRAVCIRDCITNQCMKASKKATAEICRRPCKIICGGQMIIVPLWQNIKGYHDPVTRFCSIFRAICTLQ